MSRLISANSYSEIATAVLFLHALFILWIILGAALTSSCRILQTLHIVSLLWGILTELFPWSCPLTIAENWLEARAGVQPYQGGFLLHYLDALVYPNISPTALTAAGVTICLANLAIYARRFWRARRTSLRIDKTPEI